MPARSSCLLQISSHPPLKKHKMSSLLIFVSHFHREIKLRIDRYLTCCCPSLHNVLIMNTFRTAKCYIGIKHVYTVFIGFEFSPCSFYDVSSTEYCFGYLYIISMGKNMAKHNFCVKICLWIHLKI